MPIGFSMAEQTEFGEFSEGYRLKLGHFKVKCRLFFTGNDTMDAIAALTERVSAPKLTGPLPDPARLAPLRAAALRAADHGNLKPYRFIEIAGQGLEHLGQLYLLSALATDPGLSEAQQQRFSAMPNRAPLIWVAIACLQTHPKVPEIEQLMSAACAVQNVLNAAFAQGIGAYWRTGDLAYNAGVAKGLGLSEREQVVGFIYIGHPESPFRKAPEPDITGHFQTWP